MSNTETKATISAADVEAQLAAAGFVPSAPGDHSELHKFLAGDENANVDYTRPVYAGVHQWLQVDRDSTEVIINIDTIFEGSIENDDGDTNIYLDEIGSTESCVTDGGLDEPGVFTPARISKLLTDAIWILDFDKNIAVGIMEALRDGSAPGSLKDLFKDYGVVTSDRGLKKLEKAAELAANPDANVKGNREKDTGR